MLFDKLFQKSEPAHQPGEKPGTNNPEEQLRLPNFRNIEGFQEGVSWSPQGNLRTFALSSWEAAPLVTDALLLHPRERIRITFPDTQDLACRDFQADIRDTILKYHGKDILALVRSYCSTLTQLGFDSPSTFDADGQSFTTTTLDGESRRISIIQGLRWLKVQQIFPMLREKEGATPVRDLILSLNHAPCEKPSFVLTAPDMTALKKATDRLGSAFILSKGGGLSRINVEAWIGNDAPVLGPGSAPGHSTLPPLRRIDARDLAIRVQGSVSK